VQDTWRPTPAVELIAGVRYEQEKLPVDDMQINEEWLRLTGLSNADAPASYGKISPRFSFKWDPSADHAWVFAGGIGLYHDEADVDVMASAVGNAGRVLRRAGVLANWTGALPGDTAGSGRTLTLLPSAYRPPQSLRGSVGLTRLLTPSIAVHVTADYRETTRLPRRVDLNQWVDPIGEDQFGRPLFGQLVQQGGLVAAMPGSNRRFAGFDDVIGVNTDGRSEYTAVSVLLERAEAEGVNLLASYTYSRTQDNWLGARSVFPEIAIAPGIVNAQGDEWADGRSDFDVPHRLVLAAEVPVTSSVKVAGLYRYESGAPFTPGFAAGVDLNGDGYSTNDPAFVSEAVSGISEIMSEWSCLRSQNGQFAERNSCRADALQTLDLRVSAQLLRGTARTLQLHVEALNVLQSEFGLIDNALYQVNPAGQLATDVNRRTTIPLIANPGFGEIRQRASLPRLIRAGLQFNW
jgi:hypothetical protein